MKKTSRSKEVNKEQEMTKELFAALEQLAEENCIPMSALVERIKDAILKAVRKEYDYCDDFVVTIEPENNKFEVCVLRTVVDDEPIDMNEINIDEAKTVSKKAAVGDVIPFKLSTAQFGRVAAQYAKQSIRHDIKEFEREKLLSQYEDKVHEAVSATVLKIEPATGNATLRIDKNEVYLFKNEQIPGEVLKEGDIIKVYVVDIINPDKKPAIKVSRTHRELVKRLFELEIPEIYDGTIEVKSISREAGSRTKIAVWSKDKNVDAIGSCVGAKRSRISKIVDELGGEKIDIILYNEDPAEFIAQALSPAQVVSVEITDEEARTCTVIVPNNQLSLAIGNKGQNAKLAARLTGYKIDIKPAEQPDAAPEEKPADEEAEQ